MDVTIENYNEKRQELVELNSNFLGVFLNEKEKKADKYLKELKKEYSEIFDGNIDYSVPVLTDKRVTDSRLYKFCSKMPKGADLHVHDMALLPAKELVKLLCECEEFYINTDRVNYDLKYVGGGETAPSGYMQFKSALKSGFYSSDDIVYYWTTASARNGTNIWDYFEELFVRQDAMSNNADFAVKYYDYTFRYYISRNIMHVEIHIMLTDEIEESERCLNSIKSAYYGVKADFPYFTVKIIGAGVKADSPDIKLTKRCFLNTVYANENVKDDFDPQNISDFVIGFDLVNEEDKSLPISDFAPMLLKAKKQFPAINLYIHGGESIDAENENLIDAYLLGVTRVGHGFNLYRYPDLHKRYRDAEICLEVCPISNQNLGYTRDIRNHPATEYLRSGVPLALCSDDPCFMENETLTDDYFAGVIGWNLGIAELKQLSINSIVYSGLNRREKTASLKKLKELWDSFIEDILTNG